MSSKLRFGIFLVLLIFTVMISVACSDGAGTNETVTNESDDKDDSVETNDEEEEDATDGNGEIHIGVVGPMTGGFAVYGENVVRGVELALDEVEHSFDGRNIKLHVEDSQADVEQLVTRLDSLRQRDGVDVIIGPSTGDEGEAAVQWAQNNQDILVMPGFSAPEDLTMRERTPNLIRAGWTDSQTIFHFGKFVIDELGYEKIIMVGQDYAFPWGQAAGFKRGFYENGGKEVHTIWHPTNTLDFSSILGEIQGKSDEYDAVMYNGGGADAIAFYNAWEQHGMVEHYPQMLGGTNVADVPMLSQISNHFEGVYSSMHYSEDLDHEENIKFREAYQEKHGEEADAIVLQGYDTMRVILHALEGTGGDTNNVEGLRDVILDLKIDDSPRGPLYFDEFGQVVQNIYIKKTQIVDDKLQNEVIKIYEEVSQFGPYADMKEDYMAQPVNSRDFPADTAEEYFEKLPEYFGQEYVDELEANDGWLP